MTTFRNETEFTNALLKELKKLPHSYWWRNNTGRRGGVSFGDKDSPDIEGILRGGRFIGIECKAPGEVPTDGQTAWHRRAVCLGAIVLLVDDYDLGEALRRVMAVL